MAFLPGPGPTGRRKPLLVNLCLPRPGRGGWQGPGGCPSLPSGSERGPGRGPGRVAVSRQPGAGGPFAPPRGRAAPPAPRGEALAALRARRGQSGGEAKRGKRGEARRGRAGGRRRPHGQHGLRSHALAEVRARPGQPPAQNAARAGGAWGLCRAARPRGTGGAGTPALPGRAAQLRSAPGRLPGRRGSVASRLIY